MIDAARYYDQRVVETGPSEFLKQVGHTEGGAPINEQQFAALVSQIRTVLDLHTGDRLLDLCCGNGVITHRLSADVSAIHGLELSPALTQVARGAHAGDNIEYHVFDILKLDQFACPDAGKFNKVLFYAALQHFRHDDLASMVEKILAISAEDVDIFIGFVPEHGKQKHLYHSPKRKAIRLFRRLTGRDMFGTWWRRGHFQHVAEKLGLRCDFYDVEADLLASGYRFGVKLSRHK